MRILLLISRLEVGGAEVAALDLTRALTAAGHRVHVAGMYAGGPLREELALAATSVHDGLAAGRAHLRCVWRLRRLLGRHRIQVLLILDATRNATWCGLIAALLAGGGVGRVLWLHACPALDRSADALAGFVARLRTLAPLMHVIVPAGRWARGELVRAGIPRRKLCVIPNGIDAARFRPAMTVDDARRRVGLPADAPVLVQVGNRRATRRPEWLLEAFALARRSVPAARLVLVGRGMDLPDVRAAADRARIAEALSLRGARRDVPVFLRAADAFVLATTHEMHSLSVLEAMAAGLPVVVPDIPAFADQVVHMREGLKVPPGRTPALAQAMIRVLTDPGLRARLGAAGRRRAERFTVSRMAGRFERLLRIWDKDLRAP